MLSETMEEHACRAPRQLLEHRESAGLGEVGCMIEVTQVPAGGCLHNSVACKNEQELYPLLVGGGDGESHCPIPRDRAGGWGTHG